MQRMITHLRRPIQSRLGWESKRRWRSMCMLNAMLGIPRICLPSFKTGVPGDVGQCQEEFARSAAETWTLHFSTILVNAFTTVFKKPFVSGYDFCGEQVCQAQFEQNCSVQCHKYVHWVICATCDDDVWTAVSKPRYGRPFENPCSIYALIGVKGKALCDEEAITWSVRLEGRGRPAQCLCPTHWWGTN